MLDLFLNLIVTYFPAPGTVIFICATPLDIGLDIQLYIQSGKLKDWCEIIMWK